MAQRSTTRTPPSILAVGVILVLLSASGLMAGMVTHRIQNAASPTASPVAQATSPTGPQSTATPAATTGAKPTATTSSVTQSPATSNHSQFTLGVTASPKNISPGQSLTITVTVVQKGSQTPMAGVQCFLRPPTGGGQSLLTQFPPAAVSGENGQATWQVTVPAQAPGTYRIEAVAYGQHSYSYFSYTDVVVAD